MSDQVSTPDESVAFEGGIEKAFAPGFYGGLSAAQRQRWDAIDDQDIQQTLVGAQLRVPLWRDFGFREYDLIDRQALDLYLAALGQLLARQQLLRFDVTVAFINLQEANALRQAADSALLRVQALLKEAEELVKHKVVPEYQLNQAHLEVSLREEELFGAVEALDTAKLQLRRLTGIDPTPEMILETPQFVRWAEDVAVKEDVESQDAFQGRGNWQEVRHLLAAAEARINLAREQMKPDVYLKASVSWQGESTDRFIGDSALTSDDEPGAAIQLIYQQPLGFTRERARVTEQEALVEELREQQRNVEIDIKVELAAAMVAYESARQRLELTIRASEAAQATLQAESERFRLGEGRSRQVLDAEKDLTTTIRLQAANAARVLRAQAKHQFEAGYTGEDKRVNP